jgi:maltose alpha-D-glucosyltransferase/alpha-amylase
MMQDMVEANGDAWAYMLDRLEDYNEKLLTQHHASIDVRGDVVNPLPYEKIPESVRLNIEGPVAERVRLLGQRTAEMHMALSTNVTSPDFRPEPYSLHYQRSLFAGLQSLVRGTFNNLQRNIKNLPEHIQREATEILHMRDEILATFKNIYKRKIDVVKIRIHGDYHLGQVLFTGRDFIITDFEGEPAKSYSERRLKRSALRDVAGMVRSFHYAAYSSLFLNSHIRKEDLPKLMPFAEQWYHYMAGIFVHSYLESAEGRPFIPKNKGDLEILLNTFVLEKAVYELNYELNNRPDWIIIPIKGIKAILRKEALEVAMV